MNAPDKMAAFHAERMQGMGAFQCGNDAFEFTQLESRRQCFLISCTEKNTPPAFVEVRMQGTDTGIIQSGRNTVWLYHLPIVSLHQ